MGNWSAVNGRFLAARALYPAHNLREGPPSLCQTMCSALREDDCRLAESRNTCAFCLMTSAGVSTEQDANSATPEASAWTAACGTGEGRAVPSADFAVSYVKKKTPARGRRTSARRQCTFVVTGYLTCRKCRDHDTADTLIYTTKETPGDFRCGPRSGEILLALIASLDGVQGVYQGVHRKCCRGAGLEVVARQRAAYQDCNAHVPTSSTSVFVPSLSVSIAVQFWRGSGRYVLFDLWVV